MTEPQTVPVHVFTFMYTDQMIWFAKALDKAAV